MPTELPYAADAEESLAYDELEVRIERFSRPQACTHCRLTSSFAQQVLRNQYEKEQAQKHVTTQTKFNYGALRSSVLSITFRADGRPTQHGAWSSLQRGNCRWRVSSFFRVRPLVCSPTAQADLVSPSDRDLRLRARLST
jgi:hypothetical protein